MRWAVVRAPAFKFKPLAWCVGWAFAWFAEPWFSRVPMWVWGLALVFVIAMWRLRLIRVPVEPPRVRVPTEYTMEEHRDLTDAGYVYDHEARVYRLDAHEGGWEPQSNGHGYTRWDGELP